MLRMLLVLSSLVVSTSFVACGTDSAAAPLVPTNLTVRGQQTRTAVVGSAVPSLGVRVTDTEGRGVKSVRVLWRVVAGSGTLLGLLESDQWTRTDYSGVSEVDFRPTSAGAIQVEASVQGLVGSPVVFSIDATQPPDVVIKFGPFHDCYGSPANNDPSVFVGPSGNSDVRVIVGQTVEFIYAPYLAPVCTARVVSTVEPPGGARIDSGILGIGEGFKFVALVPGTWMFSDAHNGGSGTLTAVVP